MIATATTCASCHREIVETSDGWSDGVRENPLLCLAADDLSHAPAGVRV